MKSATTDNIRLILLMMTTKKKFDRAILYPNSFFDKIGWIKSGGYKSVFLVLDTETNKNLYCNKSDMLVLVARYLCFFRVSRKKENKKELLEIFVCR